MKYTECKPCKGVDGKWYVSADFTSEFDAYHLDFERSRGNLREVAFLSTVETEEEIPDGSLVSFGNRVSVWTLID